MFDWDDTLFFTSAAMIENETDIKAFLKRYNAELEDLDTLVSNLLEKCLA